MNIDDYKEMLDGQIKETELIKAMLEKTGDSFDAWQRKFEREVTGSYSWYKTDRFNYYCYDLPEPIFNSLKNHINVLGNDVKRYQSRQDALDALKAALLELGIIKEPKVFKTVKDWMAYNNCPVYPQCWTFNAGELSDLPKDVFDELCDGQKTQISSIVRRIYFNNRLAIQDLYQALIKTGHVKPEVSKLELTQKWMTQNNKYPIFNGFDQKWVWCSTTSSTQSRRGASS